MDFGPLWFDVVGQDTHRAKAPLLGDGNHSRLRRRPTIKYVLFLVQRMRSPSPQLFSRPEEVLNLFYDDDDGTDPDRWVKFDRYPRAVIRRIIRGPRRILGLERVFLNLLAGLDRLGISY